MNREEGDFISHLNVQGRVHRTTFNPFIKIAIMNKNSYKGTQKEHLELSFCKNKSCHVLKLMD